MCWTSGCSTQKFFSNFGSSSRFHLFLRRRSPGFPNFIGGGPLRPLMAPNRGLGDNGQEIKSSGEPAKAGCSSTCSNALYIFDILCQTLQLLPSPVTILYLQLLFMAESICPNFTALAELLFSLSPEWQFCISQSTRGLMWTLCMWTLCTIYIA